MKKVLTLIFLWIFSVCSLLSFTVFGDSEEFSITDETLPVQLSSFQALPSNSNNDITIKWITQSESELIGFHIYRAESNRLSDAYKITSNALLATNSIQQSNYTYTDDEVELEKTYCYWLQILGNTANNFFGPVEIKLSFNQNNHDIEDLLLGNNLFSNYPNPFNPSTTITFSVETVERVSIKLYNIKGQFVKSLYDEVVDSPNVRYSIVWDGRDLQGKRVASGIYFAQMKAGQFSKTTKMLLTK